MLEVEKVVQIESGQAPQIVLAVPNEPELENPQLSAVSETVQKHLEEFAESIEL